jgi:hypothetical protein
VKNRGRNGPANHPVLYLQTQVRQVAERKAQSGRHECNYGEKPGDHRQRRYLKLSIVSQSGFVPGIECLNQRGHHCRNQQQEKDSPEVTKQERLAGG